jgi:hypothetical protein
VRREVPEHAGRFAADERAELLEQYAIECYTIGAAERAAELGFRDARDQ